jgi:hypothetical protein
MGGRMKKGDIIEITWDDACEPIEAAWADDEDIEKELKKKDIGIIISIGYFYKEEKGRIFIYRDKELSGNNYSAVEGIPKGMIKKIRKLK